MPWMEVGDRKEKEATLLRTLVNESRRTKMDLSKGVRLRCPEAKLKPGVLNGSGASVRQDERASE